MKTKIIWVITGVLVAVILVVFLSPRKKNDQEALTQPVPAPGNEGVEETVVNTDGGDVEEGSAREIVVEGSEYSFSPASISVREGERVKLTFKNTGNLPHSFVIDELGVSTKTISAGQSETVEFIASSDGDIAFFCSVGNHRSLGMEGVLEVR